MIVFDSLNSYFGAVHVLKLVNLLPNKVMLVLLNMCFLIALILFP